MNIKKLGLLGTFCIAFAPCAGAWGLLPGVGDESSLLYKYLGQKEVVQPVCVRTYVDGQFFPGLPDDSPVPQETLVEHMQQALNYWFVQGRAFLQASGRGEEFADILAVLPEKITLAPNTDCTEKGSLQLIYAPREWYAQVVSNGSQEKVIHRTKPVPRVRVSDEVAWTATHPRWAAVHIYTRLDLVNLPQTLAHEAGHLLGLTDQYGFMPYLIPGENMHSYFSYLHVIGKNTAALNRQLLVKKPASLMGAPRYHAAALKKMWPDDMDGLINAIDYIYVYHKKLLSPRVVNGWKSFSLVPQQVGYALAVPFQYEQGKQPEQVTYHVQTYTRKIAGLEPEDFKGLQAMFRQEGNNPLYTAVSAEQLHQWQAAQVAEQRLKRQLQAGEPAAITVAKEMVSLPAVLPSIAVSPVQSVQATALTRQANIPSVPVQPSAVSQDRADCDFYLTVTQKEMNQFYEKYGPQLNRIKRKKNRNQKLTKRETRLLQYHTQLRENQRKTAECQGILGQN